MVRSAPSAWVLMTCFFGQWSSDGDPRSYRLLRQRQRSPLLACRARMVAPGDLKVSRRSRGGRADTRGAWDASTRGQLHIAFFLPNGFDSAKEQKARATWPQSRIRTTTSALVYPCLGVIFSECQRWNWELLKMWFFNLANNQSIGSLLETLGDALIK